MKKLQQRLLELQDERNAVAKTIGAAKERGEDIAPILDEVYRLDRKLTELENEFHALRGFK